MFNILYGDFKILEHYKQEVPPYISQAMKAMADAQSEVINQRLNDPRYQEEDYSEEIMRFRDSCLPPAFINMEFI